MGHERGQLLIESMVSISIVVIGILGMVILLSRSAALNTKVVNRFIAANLAGEGIEIVKNLIDRNIVRDITQGGVAWNVDIVTGNYEVDYLSTSLVSYTDTPLKFDQALIGGIGSYQHGSGNPTIFKRRVGIAEFGSLGTNEIHVSSTIMWSLKGKDFSITLEDRFFNWRQ